MIGVETSVIGTLTLRVRATRYAIRTVTGVETSVTPLPHSDGYRRVCNSGQGCMTTTAAT